MIRWVLFVVSGVMSPETPHPQLAVVDQIATEKECLALGRNIMKEHPDGSWSMSCHRVRTSR